MAIHIGCGSWTDKEYVGVLYPKGVPPRELLAVYSQWFDRVEANSFYRAIPKREYVERWVAQTPAKFTFDVKLSREFSDDPAAAARGEAMGRFLHAAEPIIAANKLGVFLLPMPPSFSPAKHRLQELDATIEKLAPHALAVELRHRDWLAGPQRAETLDYFHAKKLVWVSTDTVAADAARLMPLLDVVTNPRHAYFRLHGRNPAYATAGSTDEGHHHDYTATELTEIAGRIKSVTKQAKEVHVTLNNHAENFAPNAAIKLCKLLGVPTLSAIPEKPGRQEELF
ncbi:MAG TPA: DUF72 domain-containing protein [Lacunisphaera sp.]